MGGKSAPPHTGKAKRERKRTRSPSPTPSGRRGRSRKREHAPRSSHKDKKEVKKESSNSYSQSSSPEEPEPPTGKARKEGVTTTDPVILTQEELDRKLERVQRLEAKSKAHAARLLVKELNCREAEAMFEERKWERLEKMWKQGTIL